MVWYWHIKNAAVTLTLKKLQWQRQNYNTSPRLKARLFILMQKKIEIRFYYIWPSFGILE